MRYREITNEIEQMHGDWSDGIASRCERHVDDAVPYAKIGGLTVKKDVDRAITALLFYDGDALVGFAMLSEEYLRPNAVEIEIAFEPAYQGRGLGMATYNFLLDQGYSIVSGYHQYPGAVAIWRKLIADPSVNVMAVYPKDANVYKSEYAIRPLKSSNEPWTTKNGYLRLMASKK